MPVRDRVPAGAGSARGREFPVRVEVEVFNPLVPGDSEASGLPVIFWRMRVVNTTSETLSVSLMLSVGNFIGQRLRSLGADDSQPTFEVRAGRGFRGLLLGERGLKREDEEWGTFAAAVVADQAAWVGPT